MAFYLLFAHFVIVYASTVKSTRNELSKEGGLLISPMLVGLSPEEIIKRATDRGDKDPEAAANDIKVQKPLLNELLQQECNRQNNKRIPEAEKAVALQLPFLAVNTKEDTNFRRAKWIKMYLEAVNAYLAVQDTEDYEKQYRKLAVIKDTIYRDFVRDCIVNYNNPAFDKDYFELLPRIIPNFENFYKEVREQLKNEITVWEKRGIVEKSTENKKETNNSSYKFPTDLKKFAAFVSDLAGFKENGETQEGFELERRKPGQNKITYKENKEIPKALPAKKVEIKSATIESLKNLRDYQEAINEKAYYLYENNLEKDVQMGADADGKIAALEFLASIPTRNERDQRQNNLWNVAVLRRLKSWGINLPDLESEGKNLFKIIANLPESELPLHYKLQVGEAIKQILSEKINNLESKVEKENGKTEIKNSMKIS